MTDDLPNDDAGGIRFVDSSGTEHIVHAYIEDDYGLADIHVLFGLGSLESQSDDEVVLVLSNNEVRTLKAMADAQSFDHPEGFIAMCLDIHGFAAPRGEGPFVFRAEG